MATFLAAAAGWDGFGERRVGVTVTDHRTSWVRRLADPAGDYHVKTYDYATWGDRLRGWGRTTGPFATSRAAREFDALVWLRKNAPPAVEPVGAFESRRFGTLRRAVLVTATFPGEPLSTLLPASEEREAIARALGSYVAQLHRLGYRDGNLDLRNLLGRRAADGSWVVVKIDSPKFRLVKPGRTNDALAAADWARLLAKVDAGIGKVVRQAACL